MPELVRDFLDPGEFFQQLKNICGIGFYCGVPDSLLKGIYFEYLIKYLCIRFRFLCLCDKKRSVYPSYYYSK
jgi:hypothetical protein